MPRTSRLTVTLLALTFIACGPSPQENEPDPRLAALAAAPAVCDAPAYSWVESDTLGDVVDTAEVTTVNFTAENIQGILGGLGFSFGRELLYDARVFQYRYVTQDRGQLTEATGLVAVPIALAGDPTGFPMLVYLHGTSGFSDPCAPSAGFADPIAAAGLAAAGYVVAAPDYLGMNGLGAPSTQLHPYVVAEPTAIASLDAVRGLRKALAGPLAETGVAPTDQLVVLGGSQGGHAAVFVNRYGPYYLPEYPILGVAASVAPADAAGESAYNVLDWHLGTPNVGAIAAAMTDWYDADLSEILVPPLDVDVPARMETTCSLSGILNPAQTVDAAYTAAFLASAGDDFATGTDTASCMFRENGLPTTSVENVADAPTLFVLGEKDPLVNTPLERVTFDTLCDQGVPLWYLECAGAEHTDAAAGSLGEQLDFLDAARAGTLPEGRCVRGAPVTCGG